MGKSQVNLSQNLPPGGSNERELTKETIFSPRLSAGWRRTFCQPMISAFSRKSRRVMFRPYLRMMPCCEPEHLHPKQPAQLQANHSAVGKLLSCMYPGRVPPSQHSAPGRYTPDAA